MATEALDLPPAPETRSISPAREDYETRPGPQAFVWPLFFFGVLAALTAAVVAIGWHEFASH